MAKRNLSSEEEEAIIAEYALIQVEAQIDRLTAVRRVLQSRVRRLGSGTARIANPADYPSDRAMLEETQLLSGGGTVDRRGERKRRKRRPLTPEERAAISKRMKATWAKRKKGKK